MTIRICDRSRLFYTSVAAQAIAKEWRAEKVFSRVTVRRRVSRNSALTNYVYTVRGYKTL